MVLQHWEVLRKEITMNQELAAILIWSTESWHAITVVFVSFTSYVSPCLLSLINIILFFFEV